MENKTIGEALTLASRSPRRTEILRNLRIPHHTIPADIDEEAVDGPPDLQAHRLAERKALAVVSKAQTRLVLGSDTVVALGNRAFGKPRDRAEAHEMLATLSGKTHRVHTGVALVNRESGSVLSRLTTTEVEFSPLERARIEWYLNSGEWRGVAGAYRIQGIGGCFIPRIHGSYSGVMGLPIETIYSMLCEYQFAWAGSVTM